MGSRSIEKGESALQEISDEQLDIELVQIDVGSLESIQKAVEVIK